MEEKEKYKIACICTVESKDFLGKKRNLVCVGSVSIVQTQMYYFVI